MRITLFYTVSADGFIAGVDDSTPWSSGVMQNYFDFCASIDTAIVGHRTYQLLVSGPWAESFSFKTIIVVSRRHLSQLRPPFISVQSPIQAVEKLKEMKRSSAILMGGGRLATSFLMEGLVSDIRLEFDSIILGDGIRQFDRKMNARLTLMSSQTTNAPSVVMCYQVKT